jgi:transposase-like protein
MAKHRSHSIEFKRQIEREFIAGETLHGLSKRHDVSRNLIRIWVQKYEAGAFGEDATAADMIQEYIDPRTWSSTVRTSSGCRTSPTSRSPSASSTSP